LYLDAEDRLNKANDDLKRVTEHIEQERAIQKEVQRRQVSFFCLMNIKCRLGGVELLRQAFNLSKIGSSLMIAFIFFLFRCNCHHQIEI
jgi:hypothetical protein